MGKAGIPAPLARPETNSPPVPSTSTSSRPASPVRPVSASHRPAKPKAAAPAADPRFPNGPVAVLDGDGTAYCLGGVLLDCPASTIPQLVDWVLKESGIGAARLNRHGKDSDPLIVLTESAAARFGLPAHLEDRRGLRLAEDHPVVKQIAKAKWKLTQRGFGPWPRIYRPANKGQRQCVQLAILPWDALDTRAWGDAASLHPADLARVLGVFATRVLTPRGSTAVTGLELMTACARQVSDRRTSPSQAGRDCPPPANPANAPSAKSRCPRMKGCLFPQCRLRRAHWLTRWPPSVALRALATEALSHRGVLCTRPALG